MKWVIDGPLCSVDTETTDKNPLEARVLDIALAIHIPGREIDLRQAIVNPGVEIPADSIAVHGITQERVEAEGKPSTEVLDLFLSDIALSLKAGIPLIVMNAPYDTTVLQCEALRLGLPTLEDRLGGPIAPVIDPGVLDKHLIKYRRRVSKEQGARQLKTIAQVYGVKWDDSKAHGAAYDTMQNLRVLWHMAKWAGRTFDELMAMTVGPFDPPKPMHRNDARMFGRLGRMSAMELHAAQPGWYRDQMEGLAEHWTSEAAKRRSEARYDNPPGDESLSADERRQVLLDDAEDLEARVAGISLDWPIRALPAMADYR